MRRFSYALRHPVKVIKRVRREAAAAGSLCRLRHGSGHALKGNRRQRSLGRPAPAKR